MSLQGFLFLPDKVCPECGIPLKDDFRLYTLRCIARAHHKLGVCVACTGINPPSRGPREVGSAVSLTALHRVWDQNAVGLGCPATGSHRLTQDTWPTMEEFSDCLEGQLALSSEDAFRRTIILLEHAAGILIEEILPALEERHRRPLKSAG